MNSNTNARNSKASHTNARNNSMTHTNARNSHTTNTGNTNSSAEAKLQENLRSINNSAKKTIAHTTGTHTTVVDPAAAAREVAAQEEEKTVELLLEVQVVEDQPTLMVATI